MAADAAPAAYRLLINHLGDIDAAYLLMREDGDRLRTFGRARQFDAWFLAQARTRGDIPALCNRLAAILRADAALAGPLANDLESTCAQLESFTITDEASLEAAGKLAASRTCPPPSRRASTGSRKSCRTPRRRPSCSGRTSPFQTPWRTSPCKRPRRSSRPCPAKAPCWSPGVG
jgi:hypothetical protein